MTYSASDTPEAEAARLLVDRQMLDYRTAIPGVVVEVSADGTMCDVQPAVSMAQTLDGKTTAIPMPVVRGVPLMVMGSTTLGFFVCVPVQPGDDGLLIVCDRAIDNWQGGQGVSMPPLGPSPRHHDMTDAVFYPGLQRASSPIPSFPFASIQVRNRDGSAMLVVHDLGVHIVGNLTVSGAITDGTGVVLGTHRHGGIQPGGGQTGPAVP